MRFRHPRRSRPAFERVNTGPFQWVYQRHGDGPPVLLVHGLSGSVGWWRHNIAPLAEHFTVYAVELAGFAGNRARRPLPLRDSAEGIVALMDALAMASAHVVGHSMGGHISLHLASQHAERVGRLVVAAPSVLLRSGLAPMAWRLARASRYGAVDMAPTIMWDALRAGPLNLLLAAQALLQDDVADLLPSITAPTLVLAGEYDTLVPPDVCEMVAHAISHASYVMLKGAGHNLMWDRAAAFNETVLDFLRAPSEDAATTTNVSVLDTGD
jgi:pimeloyl-ACP methyl ester carboxylesterase